MRVLVWQWGRFGAGPRYAHELVEAFAAQDDVDALLSLSQGAELLQTREVADCALPVQTYRSMLGLAGRMASAPAMIPLLARKLRQLRIDVALCAMPAAMDFAMAAALKLAGVPYAVVIHEADPHPGDRFPSQLVLQRWLVRGAAMLFALSSFVADRLREQGRLAGRPLLLTTLPPFYQGSPPPAFQHGGKLRLLSFGRLLPYKGLDLLAESLALLGDRREMVVRVVGLGPENAELDRLRALPGVTVENRWVAEREVGGVLAWADALVLPYREASQSGVAAAAIAARRWIVSTRVGGLPEQLSSYSRAILCEPIAADLAAALCGLPATDVADAPEPPAAVWPAPALAMLDPLRRLC